jgi:hypothetical protein
VAAHFLLESSSKYWIAPGGSNDGNRKGIWESGATGWALVAGYWDGEVGLDSSWAWRGAQKNGPLG